jgi:hypothetical protein
MYFQWDSLGWQEKKLETMDEKELAKVSEFSFENLN